MIELKHLTKHFETPNGTVAALEDINLSIGDGDIFGIIGMSGAGKSTLVRCINLLERPDLGTVTVNGQQMQSLSPAGPARGTPGHCHDLSAVQPADAAHLPEKHLLPA